MATRARPIVPKRLKAKEWPDQPMEGWKERGAEELPPHVIEAVRLGRERLAERDAQREREAAASD